jgi:hypothetical protein
VALARRVFIGAGRRSAVGCLRTSFFSKKRLGDVAVMTNERLYFLHESGCTTVTQDGPPWVVGKHAVLLQDFNVDLKPQDMVFNRLKLWARIMNLPFGYMNKKWGSVIAKALGVEGSVPVVDCDSTGRCWGNFLRAKVVIDTDKPLLRGVTVFSQRRNLADWFDVQYEQLPHYCFSCALLGHSSIECKTPGVRGDDGKLPYSGDRLCAPDARKKKVQGSRSASDTTSANRSRSPQAPGERSGKNGAGENSPKNNKSNGEDAEVSSPGKAKPRGRANQAKGGQVIIKEGGPARNSGKSLAGQKRKTQRVYRVKNPRGAEEPVGSLALVACSDDQRKNAPGSGAEEVSSDSNKKMRKDNSGSADQAGAVEQPRQTQ